jgi:hypothetical protein
VKQARSSIGAKPTKIPTSVTPSWTGSPVIASLERMRHFHQTQFGFSWSICRLDFIILGTTTQPKKSTWWYLAMPSSNAKVAPIRHYSKATHRFMKAINRTQWRPWMTLCFALSHGGAISKHHPY